MNPHVILCLAYVSACMANAASQLESEVEVVELRTTPSYKEVVYGQKTQGNQLILTPDSCFFFPTGPRLTGKTLKDIPGVSFNGGQSFEAITRVRTPGQLIQWPLLPMKESTWNIEVYIDTPESGVELNIRLGDIQHRVQTHTSDGTNPQPWNLSAQVNQAGASPESVRFLEIELLNLNGASEVGRILKVRLHGPEMTDDYLLRARWRPAAIHGGFESSSLKASGLAHDLLVVEQTADYSSPISLDFYSPITTSFGYYGSVFKKVPEDTEGRFTASSPNFSMWNYGRNVTPPPLPQFSHPLVLGNPNKSLAVSTTKEQV